MSIDCCLFHGVRTEDLVNPERMKRESDFGGHSYKPTEGLSARLCSFRFWAGFWVPAALKRWSSSSG